jgi:hypothetical protein
MSIKRAKTGNLWNPLVIIIIPVISISYKIFTLPLLRKSGKNYLVTT